MRLFENKYPIPDDVHYVVNFVYDSECSHYDLVRLSDSAILCSFTKTIDVIVRCWELEILRSDVVFI